MHEQVFEIYIHDLTEEAQARLIEFLGDNGNYDVFPIAEITREVSEEE